MGIDPPQTVLQKLKSKRETILMKQRIIRVVGLTDEQKKRKRFRQPAGYWSAVSHLPDVVEALSLYYDIVPIRMRDGLRYWFGVEIMRRLERDEFIEWVKEVVSYMKLYGTEADEFWYMYEGLNSGLYDYQPANEGFTEDVRTWVSEGETFTEGDTALFAEIMKEVFTLKPLTKDTEKFLTLRS
jgi:hypothetical protein